jgi:hypothetical protein
MPPTWDKIDVPHGLLTLFGLALLAINLGHVTGLDLLGTLAIGCGALYIGLFR